MAVKSIKKVRAKKIFSDSFQEKTVMIVKVLQTRDGNYRQSRVQ